MQELRVSPFHLCFKQIQEAEKEKQSGSCPDSHWHYCQYNSAPKPWREHSRVSLKGRREKQISWDLVRPEPARPLCQHHPGFRNSVRWRGVNKENESETHSELGPTSSRTNPLPSPGSGRLTPQRRKTAWLVTAAVTAPQGALLDRHGEGRTRLPPQGHDGAPK